MSKKILIIEDERTIADILKFNLSREGYKCLIAEDGKIGYKAALAEPPDMILLDIMLPGMDGFEVCKKLREKGVQTPIIMITARGEESDKVLGLDIGADDYVTKPFALGELSARIKANMRRTAAPRSGGAVTQFDGLTIHADSMEAKKQGRSLDLSQREFDLLSFLAKHANQVFSREELMEKVWNYEYYGDLRTVDVTVRRLREKVEDNPAEPRYIVTRRGAGYMFAGE